MKHCELCLGVVLAMAFDTRCLSSHNLFRGLERWTEVSQENITDILGREHPHTPFHNSLDYNIHSGHLSSRTHVPPVEPALHTSLAVFVEGLLEVELVVAAEQFY